MKRNLNQKEIRTIVRRVILEREENLEMIKGISYNENTELIDDVIMRIKEYGEEYKRKLNKLNFDFPTERYKRVPRPSKDTFELPSNVKVSKSIFPSDE